MSIRRKRVLLAAIAAVLGVGLSNQGWVALAQTESAETAQSSKDRHRHGPPSGRWFHEGTDADTSVERDPGRRTRYGPPGKGLYRSALPTTPRPASSAGEDRRPYRHGPPGKFPAHTSNAPGAQIAIGVFRIGLR